MTDNRGITPKHLRNLGNKQPERVDGLQAKIAKMLGWVWYDEDEEMTPFAGMWVERDGKTGHPPAQLDAIVALFRTELLKIKAAMPEKRQIVSPQQRHSQGFNDCLSEVHVVLDGVLGSLQDTVEPTALGHEADNSSEVA